MADRATVIERLKGKINNMEEAGEEIVGHVLNVGITQVTAFGFGLARTYWGDQGELTIGGVDADLVAGIAGIGLGVVGTFGRMSTHVVSAGNGALACWSTIQGMRAGEELKSTATSGRRLAGRRAFNPRDLLHQRMNEAA